MNKGELVISLFIYSTNLMTFSHISFYDIRYISTLRNVSTFRHPATGCRLREARMSRQASFIVARLLTSCNLKELMWLFQEFTFKALDQTGKLCKLQNLYEKAHVVHTFGAAQ